MSLAAVSSQAASEPGLSAPDNVGFAHRGFYLHSGWTYDYPFAVRTWQQADYQGMFRLLRKLGFDTVMLWPMTETTPAPISEADRQALGAYRTVIDEAHGVGLQCWLTQCAALTTRPEIRAKPWLMRSLMPYAQTVRLDDPDQARPYLEHRAAMMEILNNADAYVTIDGDPGGYPGAKPAEFINVLLQDRQTIDRFGTHPKEQKIVPWIWCGWGTKGVWQEPITPFVTATLEAIKRELPESWELLPGRSFRDGHANGRINLDLIKQAGLLDRSTLLLYEIVEFEPTPPAAILQFADIRRVLKEELAKAPGAHGCIGNAQQPIMVLPNLYLFARGAADPSYLDVPDEIVLGDLARLFGGPPELLIPAWSCLERGLDALSDDLPDRLRAARLDGEAAMMIPGGSKRYLEILASQVDSRIRLLKACRNGASTPEAAAEAVATGTAALVDWWKIHHYVQAGEGNEPFQWGFVHPTQVGLLKQWCAQHVYETEPVLSLAVRKLVAREVLAEREATLCVQQLLAR